MKCDSCNSSDGWPVTICFAHGGNVLTIGFAKRQEKQPFKFHV